MQPQERARGAGRGRHAVGRAGAQGVRVASLTWARGTPDCPPPVPHVSEVTVCHESLLCMMQED